MPAPVVCPTCGSSLDIPPELIGRQVRCASCGSVFTPAGDPGRPPAELLAEFRALPIRPAVMEKWLWRNAARLLKLDREAP